ncbi:hypothetical protein TSOC_005109 [Tetrabaena socialis]|uniref:Uncharacterized protein n=1 Tax=Tetrabaena socialis TaxID=47790 RepID=A0A2J8A780_9CHLO|nr:hypothetical protein TSOC_005109 [Tetrabaena socialis]|eukprot:PNH08367.1 hypothetical protein TSOC_005109 [Tetrabaena socialis]
MRIIWTRLWDAVGTGGRHWVPVPHHAFVQCWASPDAMRTLAWLQHLELPRLTAHAAASPTCRRRCRAAGHVRVAQGARLHLACGQQQHQQQRAGIR